MPVVLVTLVEDETGVIQAYGWFKILISKDEKPDQFFDIPDLGKVPYICGLFNLSTAWHEFSFFVLEALKVDYTEFIRTYDFKDIYAYVPTAKGPKFQSVVSGTVEEDTYLNLGYAVGNEWVSLGQAMYSMDASGSGINDAFSWLVNPRGIGEGKSNEIYFLFVKDDQRVFFKMSAEVAGRAKLDFAANKIDKEWFDDIDGEANNTVRINVFVPVADQANPYYAGEKGGDVVKFDRDLNEYFVGLKPVLALNEEGDPIYENFFNTAKGVDPDAGEDVNGDQNPDRFDDPELDNVTNYFFAQEQPEIAGTQLYTNWWGDVVVPAQTRIDRVWMKVGQHWSWRQGRYVDDYDWVEVEVVVAEEQTYAKDKLLYVASYGQDKKMITKTVTDKAGKEYVVPTPLEDAFISWIKPRTDAIAPTGLAYKTDTIMYFNNAASRELLNLWPHTETDQNKMLYAEVVAKSTYGPCGIELEDATFHVRFLRPLDVIFTSQDVAEESQPDGHNVQLVKFITGIVDWNDIPVIVPEKKNGKATGYYVENVTKGINMYKYYVFSNLRIDLGETLINNIIVGEPEKFVKLSEALPKAQIAIGTVNEDGSFSEITTTGGLVTVDGRKVTVNISDFDDENLRDLVLNYRNGKTYSDPFSLKLKVAVDYAWGTLEDYLLINVDETTVHEDE
jgi:hypothetical protein